jgi:small conductance mechanosensitive channel
VDLTVTASYNTPTDKVIAALYEAAKVPGALTDPAPFAAVSRYGDSSIEYILRIWTKTDDYWDVYYLINQNVRDIFLAQDIKMAYPHMHVYMEQ